MLTREIINKEDWNWDKIELIKYANRFVGKQGLTMAQLITKPFPAYYPARFRSFEFRIKLLKLFPADNSFWKPIIKKSIEDRLTHDIAYYQKDKVINESAINQLEQCLAFMQKDEIPTEHVMNVLKIKASCVWTQIDMLDDYCNWFGWKSYPHLGELVHRNPQYTMEAICQALGIQTSQIPDKDWIYGDTYHA